jgi:hypothetical protein
MIRTSLLLTLAMVVTIAIPLFATDQEKVLYNFAPTPYGADPAASLVFDKAGNLYGTTNGGGQYECDYMYGCGNVFQLTPQANGQWKETVLYTFTGGTDGCSPSSNLIFDAAGNLYGTTSGYEDGYDGCNNGTVFELLPGANDAWTFKLLYGFEDYGATPGGLVLDKAGNLYGPTLLGGSSGWGSVFELSPRSNGTWVETVLYSFDNTDGSFPVGSLIFDKAGNLYGITAQGGTGNCNHYGCGVVFELSREKNGQWTQTVLYNFNDADGANPAAGLIADANGNLYGTTESGGFAGGECLGGGLPVRSVPGSCGLVFEMAKGANGTWTETVLHYFSGNHGDGNYPAGTLTFDAVGNLYGTTELGGVVSGSDCEKYGCGTVFELSPGVNGGWTETVVHRFGLVYGADGEFPEAGVILDKAGNLYGDTVNGGTYDVGTVFEITP